MSTKKPASARSPWRKCRGRKPTCTESWTANRKGGAVGREAAADQAIWSKSRSRKRRPQISRSPADTFFRRRFSIAWSGPSRDAAAKFSSPTRCACWRRSMGLYALIYEGKSYDAGDKLGFLKATVEFALENPEFGEDFREYLQRPETLERKRLGLPVAAGFFLSLVVCGRLSVLAFGRSLLFSTSLSALSIRRRRRLLGLSRTSLGSPRPTGRTTCA